MVEEAKRLDLPLPDDDWQFHDLRRSSVTWLAATGFAVHVADKLLGHVSGAIRGVAAVYQRHEFLPERKAAMLAWGQHVEDVVESSPRYCQCGADPRRKQLLMPKHAICGCARQS